MRRIGVSSIGLAFGGLTPAISQFARGPANEQFSWRVEQGAPLLLGYHVNSALLVTE